MMFKNFLKPFIWLGVICYGLFIPASCIPKSPLLKIPYVDKQAHIGLFFIFCLLLFVPCRIVKLNPLFFAPLISLILAAVLEGMQQYISSSRSSNFFDFLANAAGIAVAMLFFHFLISGKKWEKYL